jgi:peptidoglycan-associated lipoprotein
MRHRSFVSGALAMLAITLVLLVGGCSWLSKKEVSASPATGAGGLGEGADAVRLASLRDGRSGEAPGTYRSTDGLRDVHFDFDRYDIRAADGKTLEDNAAWIRSHPEMLVLIEGHADERGTNEYNLTLGDRRSKSTINFLVSHGIASSRLSAVSYGAERPVCQDKSEDCWAQNRRAHFLVKSR